MVPDDTSMPSLESPLPWTFGGVPVAASCTVEQSLTSEAELQ